MAITQQAVKLRPNESYNGGSSGLRTCWHKFEFDAPFDQVQHLIGSKVASGTPGTYKVQFAVTDTIAVDTVNNAWVPMRAGVAYNDKSANGWKDATFGGAATKQIGLAPSQGNNSVIHMSTDVMNLSSIPRADGKPGGILLVKVVQIDSAGQYTQGSSNSAGWDAARGLQPWFREWFCNATSNVDGIANLGTLPSGTPFNGDYVFPGTPIVTNTASSLPTDLLMFTGDSRKSAAYNINRFATPARMAAMSLSTPAHPISTVNAAGSGHNQSQYLALAMDHLNAGLRPTVIHLPAFSQNGFTSFANFKTANDNFMAAARAIPGLTNVKFVLDTDYYVGGYTVGTSAETGRRECIAYAKSLADGVSIFCFDSDAIITDYTNANAPTFKTAYFTSPNFIGGDGVHAGPPGLNAMAYGDGVTQGLEAVYISAFGISAATVTPGGPAAGTATAGALSASVAFSAPASNGGPAPIDYTVISTPGNFTATGSSSPIAVSGLAAGTSYNFAVRARNSNGPGPYSIASNSVTPTAAAASDTTAPAMTGSITVSAQTASGFTLTWQAATDDTAVTAYEVDNGSGAYANVGTARTTTVSGKSPATTYNVRVRALDAAGNVSSPLTATATTSAASTPSDSTAPPTFTPSTSRTIIIGVVPGSFNQDGSFWNLANPKKPTGSIDPNSTIDITFDWTKVLADIDAGIADVVFDIAGLTAGGAYGTGAFATIFVSSATGAASITCRITTDSVPPRIEDRTVFLTVEQH